MEDAVHYFNAYYGGKRYFSTIFQHPNGYYNVLNNFVAWLTSQQDVRYQSLLYHLFSLTTGFTVASCLLFSRLIKTPAILLVMPLTLGLSGMNHIYYHVSLTFQMYNVVILLLALLLFPPPKTWAGCFILSLLAALLIWSGPYSVIALPISLLLIVFFKDCKKNVFLSIVIITTLFYLLSVEGGMLRLGNIFDPWLRHTLYTVLFQKIFFLDLLGSLNLFKVFFFLTAYLFVHFYLRKDYFFLKMSLILLALILASLAPLFLSKKILLYRTYFPCHIYIGQFFWLFFILFSLDRIALNRNLFTSKMSWLVIVLFFSAVTLYDQKLHPEKGYRKIMVTIPGFLDAIYQAEQLNLDKENTYVVIKTDNIVPGTLHPMVRVGSLRHDAVRLGRKDIPFQHGKEFIIK